MNPIHLAAVSLAFSASAAHAQWQPQMIDTDVDFRGLCAVSDKVAWVSGTRGTHGRSTDGGKTWSVGPTGRITKFTR